MSMSDDGRPLGEDIPRPTEDGETYACHRPTPSARTPRSSAGSRDPRWIRRSPRGRATEQSAIRRSGRPSRELREDAATTALEVNVEAIQGGTILTGTVIDITEAESTEEVAGRVTGFFEVHERLEVESLSRERGDEART